MRYYSSVAPTMALTGSINAGVTSAVVDTVTGLPASTPFTLVIDPGGVTEEIVTVTGVAGTTLTITRGEDGSTAQSHSLGATVRHMASARDMSEPQEHIAATENIHGVGSGNAVVGTGTTQTLTNKSISGASNTLTAIPSSAVTGLDAHTAATAAHGATGAVVGTTNAQTLTNKTISGASNTLSAIPSSAVTGLNTHTAATAAHGATGAVVGTTNTQTLTNKTISGASNTLSAIPQSAVTNLTADLSTLTTAISTESSNRASAISAQHATASSENLALNALYEAHPASPRTYQSPPTASIHKSATAALNGGVRNVSAITIDALTEYQLTATAMSAAYRPAKARIFPAYSSHGPGVVIVNTDGHVYYELYDAVTSAGAGTWYLWLDSCRWDV